MADKPSFVTTWIEPESAANTNYQPVYPYNNVTQTKGGHSFEMDDTPTRERIRLQHGKGTFVEMHPNGDQVTKILGDGYTIILGDHNISIGVDDGQNKKKLNITVYGDVSMHVTGNKVEQVDGNVEQYIKGNYRQTVEGLHTVSSFGNMEINAGASILGKLTVNVPDYVKINGDLAVSSEIKGQKITSETRVDAGTGISAGALGFVSITGGLSIGIPAALPSNIICAGPITSFSSVNAPLGNFGISKSILATDIINQLIRSFHFHIAKGGPTTPPTSKEDVVGDISTAIPA
jgi:hypothetical protein